MKMLAGPLPKETPLKDALFETFCALQEAVKVSIPKFINKALRILRREANNIRLYNEEELKDDVE